MREGVVCVLALGACAGESTAPRVAAVFDGSGSGQIARIEHQWDCDPPRGLPIGGIGSAIHCEDIGPARLFLSGVPLHVPVEPNEYRDLYWFSEPGIVLFDAANEPLSLVVDDRSGTLLWTPPLFSVPSPDGRLIASIDKEEEGLVVRLWESRTGMLVGVPRVVRVGSAALRWTPDGRVQVGAEGKVDFLEVEGEPTTELAWEGCWWPKTSSSAWDADGRNAAPGAHNNAGEGRGYRYWDEECPDHSPF